MSHVRRTTGFIDREVQTRLISRVALHWGALILGQGMGLMFWTVFTSMPDLSAADVLHRFSVVFLPVLGVSLALLPVFLVDTVKLSNRFAGPILRLRRTLQSINAGEPTEPLKFRDNDFWQALATDFNQALKLRTEAAADNEPAASGECDSDSAVEEAEVACTQS